MKLSDFLAGVFTGVIAGITISEAVRRMDRNVSAERVLNSVKAAFKEEGPIDGSWISMKTEHHELGAIKTEVYKGGISRIRNGEAEIFEFAADAKTGSVLELSKI